MKTKSNYLGLAKLIVFFLMAALTGHSQSNFANLSGTEQSLQRQTNLKEIAERHSKAFDLQKANIQRWADQTGLPIRQVSDSTGTIVELMRIENGRLFYYSTHNAQGANLIKTDRLYPMGDAAMSLTGAGQILGIWDGGAVSPWHNDLVGRVTQQDATSSVEMHPTHVAGTMIGAGTFPLARGMAYQGHLFAWDWYDDLSEMAAAAADGLKISQHSYGVTAGWQWDDGLNGWKWHGDITVSETEDAYFGYYSEYSKAWDEIAWNAPDYLIITSAGNDRGLGPEPGETHFALVDGNWESRNTIREKDGGWDGYDCIAHFGIAKNVVTVGAVDHNRSMAAFSAWGPTDDGRVKPDIVAKGVSVWSAFYGNPEQSFPLSGTSMAGPMVSGSLGLLMEYQENLNPGIVLPAATWKALILHSADDMIGGLPGPDYRFGWGLMDTQRAAQIMTNNHGSQGIHIHHFILEQNQQVEIPVLASGMEPLRATIAWTDPAGIPIELSLNNRTPMLVNDLDLRITGPDGTEYHPWVLDPESPSSAATTGDNVRDNVEMVHIDSPVQQGEYTLMITHKGTLSGGQQAFSLIVTGNFFQNSPVVLTTPITEISETSASLGGNIVFDGGMEIVAHGIVWDTQPEPSLTAHLGITIGGNVSGEFFAQATGLQPFTTYYARAYATNNSTTAYGNTLTFTTPNSESLFAGGVGSPGDPFLIANPEHLNNVRQVPDGNFRQIADIFLGISPWNEEEGWEPIMGFSGVYDGSGFAIDGLTINRPYLNSTGLFGNTQKANIHDLYLSEVSVTGNNKVGGLVGSTYAGAFYLPTKIERVTISGNVSGNKAVGGLAGKHFASEISHCHSQASVQGIDYVGGLIGVIGDFPGEDGSGFFFVGGYVGNSTTDCEVTGINDVGGLVGRNESGIISQCNSLGIINGSNSIGGLVGDLRYGVIEQSYADCITTTTGSNAGGLVGYSINGSIVECTSKGTVLVSSDSGGIGGLVGNCHGSILKNNYSHTNVSGIHHVGGLLGDCSNSQVINCFSTGSVESTTNDRVGGLIGFSWNSSIIHSFWDTETSGMTNSDGGIGKTTIEMTEPSTFMAAGWDLKGYGFKGTWNIAEGYNQNYPFLSWEFPDVTTNPYVLEPHLPYIGSIGVTKVGIEEAVLSAQLTALGKPIAQEYGFCWNTSGNPTINDQVYLITTYASYAPFHKLLEGLIPATSYYVRAFATNNLGTEYSSEIMFTTLSDLPSLTTTTPTNISNNSAISGGIVSVEGIAPVTAKGVVWGLTQNPTITNNQGLTNDGSGLGSFESHLTGLSGGTYYVRAYATNNAGTAYGNQFSFETQDGTYKLGTVHCGIPTPIVDIVSPITGNTWMDRNMGANQVATSSTDSLAFGDLFQWGRSADGHQCRDSNKTPILSSTDKPGHGDFITTANFSDDWLITQNDNLWQGVEGDNNPCPVGYRLPTQAELDAERESWSTNNSQGAFGSALKLTTAGYRYYNGELSNVYVSGSYWSSSISGNRSFYLSFHENFAGMTNFLGRVNGHSIRCIKNINVPSLSTTTPTNISHNSAISGGNVTDEGITPVTARGVVWGLTQNPTITNNQGLTNDGSGLGSFESHLTGLSGGTYYVRAYATNNSGTAYGKQFSFETQDGTYRLGTVHCGIPTPVVDIVSPITGKTWMDRNMGANQVATSSTDSLAFGDLFQWGRSADGHQCRDSNKTPILSTTVKPGHGDFITTTHSSNDWLITQNDNLWQGVEGENNPCPVGYRLPTHAELDAECESWSTNNSHGAFGSALKLTAAGYRYYNGSLSHALSGTGRYWSSTMVNGNPNAVTLTFNEYDAACVSIGRANGHSIRCIKSISNTSIGFAQSLNSIRVFPNPVSNEVFIEVADISGSVNFEITNAVGQVLTQGKFVDKTSISTQGFNSGLLFVKVQIGDSIKVFKIMKK